MILVYENSLLFANFFVNVKMLLFKYSFHHVLILFVSGILFTMIFPPLCYVGILNLRLSLLQKEENVLMDIGFFLKVV